ncbi:hypothetical protein [Psychrobacillus sp. NPDC096623]|uniref:hypothetical protein n=1 Tax=Psychrobacillus sp. NPDC096623 TaxID=3364492 RepID=UPI0037FEBF1F
MRKLLISIAKITILLTVFLIYNHKQLPSKDGVFNITENWAQATEEVYLVKKIDGEWLTIFRNTHSIMLGRLEQNWLGFWTFKDDNEMETTLVSTYHPPLQEDDFIWGASITEVGKPSYYFGQIINPEIRNIEIETQKNSFESALLINSGQTRFFYLKLNGEVVMPININGFSETGKLIYSTIKPIKED